MSRVNTCALTMLIACVFSIAISSGAQASARDKNHCVEYASDWPPLEDVTPPTLIRKVPPRYPFKSLVDKVNGLVVIQFTVSKDGKVENPRIVCSDPKRRFDAAALDSVREWLYRPATRDGQPVAYPGMHATVAFAIKGSF